MNSNFEFLKLNVDENLQELFPLAKEVEQSYINKLYAPVFSRIRSALEYTARMVADQCFIGLPEMSSFNDVLRELKKNKILPTEILEVFYDLKKKGNEAAHNVSIKFSQNEALMALQKLYTTLVWLVNEYYDQDVQSNFKEPVKEDQYQTMAERKLIYVQTANNIDGMWPAYQGSEKIGEASAPADELETDWSPNSTFLRGIADRRIRQYMKTSGVPYNLEWTELAWIKSKKEWFHDYDVHNVLERSNYQKNKKVTGEEWFNIDLKTAKKAITAVKEGRTAIDGPKQEIEIELRPEQKAAVEQTRKVFKKPDKILWNAKMRFGKTVAALQLIKEEQYRHILIMTHRPVVSDSWFEDFGKMRMNEAGYQYGSKNKGQQLNYLVESETPFIYFASIQDLRGSEAAGGKQGEKNELIFSTKWDLVIIDEAHEGTKTALAHNVLNLVNGNQTRILELSGTPFNLIDDYDNDHVFTWDYVMEQEAKTKWAAERPNEKNPYEKLPKVSMYTFAMKNHDYLDEQKSFNFKEFFRTEENGRFTHERDVNSFLNEITTEDSKTNYPYSTRSFRDKLRHTLWLVPSVKAAKALTKLLKKHPVFGKEYQIINVVDNDKSDTIESAEDDDRGQSDVDRVRKIITEKAYETKTITISVRRLTTGVNVPEWTAIMFLNNTTSAMQYLQAAFRAQTPYSDERGMKENCYIFDFAPDRALTIMAESTSLNTGTGKLVSWEQRKEMERLLNFLPILGVQGNGMQEYKVDKLLTQIKRVYAEKAVRSGFDDDSLYSDELLKLDEADLSDFKNLQSIIGSTKKTKVDKKVDVNKQGLSDEEYDRAEHGKKKKKKERTPEEQAAIEKMNSLKKQKKTMISVLRGISIRIPLMIYGMRSDLADDITLDKFVKFVDQQSWKEFMPKGITKGVFAKFKKYYDPEVFIEAGRIIRKKVKELDSSSPIDRTEELATIFGTFKNPDKETVLTPWNVVNRHLASTIGGLSFFDSNFEIMRAHNVPLTHWVKTSETTSVFKDDTRILEINSKTGLYPLYAATSLYWKAFNKLNSDQAGKFTAQDEDHLWQKILSKNIYVVAKTPMAKTITQRTLAGYNNWTTNILYVEEISKKIREDISETIGEIQKGLNVMKFDVVVGNPPYQENDNDSGNGSAKPLYHKFIELSIALKPEFITLITPSVWFTGGKGLDSFRNKMINDRSLEKIVNYVTPKEVFPTANLRGGVNYFLWNRHYDNKKDGVLIQTIKNSELKESGNRPITFDGLHILISSNISYKIIERLVKNNSIILDIDSEYMLSKYVSVRNPFGFSTTFTKTNDFKMTDKDMNSPVKIHASGGKSGYIERNTIGRHADWIDRVKILTPFANNIGTDLNDDNLNTIIVGKNEIATETYLVIGAELKLDQKQAENIEQYLHTKFVRFLISLAKANQNGTRSTYLFVPMQDFSPNSDLNFDTSANELDTQLFKKYHFSNEEIDHVITHINYM